MAKQKSPVPPVPPVPPENQLYNDLLAQSLINYNAQNQGLPVVGMGMGGGIQYSPEPLPPVAYQNLPPPPINPAMLDEYNKFLNISPIQKTGSSRKNRPTPPPFIPTQQIIPSGAPNAPFVGGGIGGGRQVPPAAMQFPLPPAANYSPIPQIPPAGNLQPPLPQAQAPIPPPSMQPSVPNVAPTFNNAMAMQTYNNLMQQQLNALIASRMNEPLPPPAQSASASNKVAQNYAGLTPGQMNQQNQSPIPPIPETTQAAQPPGFASTQPTQRPRGGQSPRVGFGYLPQNQIAPVGF